VNGQLHIGRRPLCETGEVTDTRQPESRPGAGPFALTAAEIAAVEEAAPEHEPELGLSDDVFPAGAKDDEPEAEPETQA